MSKSRILIVEDEAIVARDISQQLIELGYEPVGTCIRGEEAVAAAEKLRPDLVLMDIQLAGDMDGIAAAQLIRDRLALPVVFLTAFAEGETINRTKLTEPFGYIIKPFDERELRTVIEIALFKHGAEDRLRESEERFRTLIETSMDAVVLSLPDETILHVNAAACAMFGATEEEMKQAGSRAFMDLTDPLLREGLKERIRTGRFRGEVMLVRRNREKFPAEVSTVVFKTSDGQERLSRVIRDISERRKAQQSLRLLGAAFEATANAIIITDRTGLIQWANTAFADLSGYPLAEVLGRNPRELVKSDAHLAGFYREMWETILAGKVWTGEITNRRKSGESYQESMTITPVRDSQGAITHFIAMKQDITERKRVEEALRLSEERHRLLFDHNPLPMWLYDVETLRFMAVNDTALKNYGYTREEFLALTIAQIRPEEDLDRFMSLVRQTRDESVSFGEWRHRRKDGSIFHVEVMSRPLVFNARPARLVLAADVSAKKLLQEQFLRAQRLESLGMLASGIAHDLNNMLAPIIFAAPLLRPSVSAPRDLRILDTLESTAERGASLVRQILAFAHGSSENPRITQLKHIVRDVLAIVEVSFPKNIRLEQHVASNVWPVLANPTQIHQAMLNLCINARDAMPHGGTLTVRARNLQLDPVAAAAIPAASAGDWLVIEVTDTGTGIPPEVLPRIWDSFYTTKAPDQGTGLGLPTVRNIVNGHQGFIQLETTVGQGTTFRLFLPASPDEETKADSGSPFPFIPGRQELILLVDDDSSIREIVSVVLRQAGYRVLACADGVEAIVNYNAKSREIALVITDVDMPNLDGAILAGTLLKMKPGLKILAISGLDGDGSKNHAVQEIKGLVAALLVKPFPADTLLATVRRILEPDAQT